MASGSAILDQLASTLVERQRNPGSSSSSNTRGTGSSSGGAGGAVAPWQQSQVWAGPHLAGTPTEAAEQVGVKMYLLQLDLV